MSLHGDALHPTSFHTRYTVRPEIAAREYAFGVMLLRNFCTWSKKLTCAKAVAPQQRTTTAAQTRRSEERADITFAERRRQHRMDPPLNRVARFRVLPGHGVWDCSPARQSTPNACNTTSTMGPPLPRAWCRANSRGEKAEPLYHRRCNSRVTAGTSERDYSADGNCPARTSRDCSQNSKARPEWSFSRMRRRRLLGRDANCAEWLGNVYTVRHCN